LVFGTANEIIRQSIGAGRLSDYRLFSRFWRDIMGMMMRSLIEMKGVVFVAGRWGDNTGMSPKRMAYMALVLDKNTEA